MDKVPGRPPGELRTLLDGRGGPRRSPPGKSVITLGQGGYTPLWQRAEPVRALEQELVNQSATASGSFKPWHGYLSVTMAARILGEDRQKVLRRIWSGELAAEHDGDGTSWEIPTAEIDRILDMRREKLLEGRALLEAAGKPDHSE